MKTGHLIEALAADARIGRGTIATTAAIALSASALLTMVIFFGVMGLRPDIGSRAVLAAVGDKLAVTLSMAAVGLILTMRLTRPEALGKKSLLLLLLPVAVLATVVAANFWQSGATGWQQHMIGKNGLHCLMAIPMLGILPLAAVVLTLARGAVTQHASAGIAAGVAAAGISASFYALYCPDDSPLFIALWYSAATLILVGAGYAVCRRMLRW